MLKHSNKIKLVIYILVTTLAFCWAMWSSFACSWSDSPKLYEQLECGALLSLKYLFSLLLLIVAAWSVYRDKKRGDGSLFTPGLMGFILSVLAMALIFIPNPIFSNHQKVVWLGGVTQESCQDGGPIYPWGIRTAHYESKCEEFHLDCSTLVDGDEPDEYFCYVKHDHKFKNYVDCDILKNSLSLNNCKLKVAMNKNDYDYCLSETYNLFVGQNPEGIAHCLAGATDFPSRASANYSYGYNEKTLARCAKYSELQKDVCLFQTAFIYHEYGLCDYITDNIDGLKEYCNAISNARP